MESLGHNEIYYKIVDSGRMQITFKLTKDAQYLIPMGDLWASYSEYFGKKWLCCKGNTEYI